MVRHQTLKGPIQNNWPTRKKIEIQFVSFPYYNWLYLVHKIALLQGLGEVIGSQPYPPNLFGEADSQKLPLLHLQILLDTKYVVILNEHGGKTYFQSVTSKPWHSWLPNGKG